MNRNMHVRPLPTIAHPNDRQNDLGERVWTIVDLRDEIDRFASMLRAEDKRHGTIASYVTQAERFVNWLEGTYKPRARRVGKPHGWTAGPDMQSKYNPLRQYLQDQEATAVRMTFRQIEDVLGCALPRSARQYAHWWANDTTGNHSQAQAWLAAGRKVVKLDLIEQRVMFVDTGRNTRPSAVNVFG